MPAARASSPEVAIVVPCHGHARFLADAVESAVAQTWPNVQVVVVDDGSPDDAAAVAAGLVARHPGRVRLVRQANQGLAAARNAGVRATAAELVLPLDADDRLEPHAVERLVHALLSSGGDVATPLGRTFGDEERPLATRPVTAARLRRNNCLVYASLYRRTVFDRVGGYRADASPGYEDWDFWLCALEHGARFVHVPEPLFRYRKHGTTMLAVADARAMRLHAVIASRHPRLFARWRVRLAERVLRAGARASIWLRVGMLATFLLDRRLRLFWRQAIALRATNMLST